MELDLQMFAEGDKTISLANLQKFKEKCDETYAKIGSEYNVLDLGALTINQTITLTDEQLALFQADNTVVKITFNEAIVYLFKSYTMYADAIRGDVYAMVMAYFDQIIVLSIRTISVAPMYNNQVQLTQNTFNYASANDFAQIQQWAKDTTTKIPNSKLNIDSELSSTSTNAVQNKVVNEALNNTVKKTGSSEAQIIQGDVSITGDLTVSGTTTTANTETLVVKDNMIVTNSEGTTLSNLSGLFIKTGTSSGYAIVYDPSSNSVILGEGTINSSGEVTVESAERKQIATRKESDKIEDGHLLQWNSTEKILEDSGLKKSDVQSAMNNANNALQTETDPTVPAWAKAANKPSYTASEISTDSSHRFVSDAEKDTWNNKANSSEVIVRKDEVSDSDDNYIGECSVRSSTNVYNHMLLNLKGAGGGSECQIKVSDDNGPKLDIRYGYSSEPNGDFLRMASVNDLNNYMPKTGGTFTGDVEINSHVIRIHDGNNDHYGIMGDYNNLRLQYKKGDIIYDIKLPEEQGTLATQNYVHENIPKLERVWSGSSTTISDLSLDVNSLYMIQIFCSSLGVYKSIVVKLDSRYFSDLIGTFYVSSDRFRGIAFRVRLNGSSCTISFNNGNGFAINFQDAGLQSITNISLSITNIYKIL